MMRKILAFFDKLEDRVRRWFSRRPLFYAFVGGIGVVLFWRGVWHTMDFVMEYYFKTPLVNQSIDIKTMLWWDGPLSIIIGILMLLLTGIFTSSFIGNEIIISGIKGEKKMVEKTELEIKSETESMDDIKKEIKLISSQLEEIGRKIDKK